MKDSSNNTDIAIIGMAGKFPMAENIEEFWNNIRAGRECITHYTNEDLSNADIDLELLQLSNYIKSKGELKDIEFFDAPFFNINPKDAELMDPQHRVMLETAWNAFEHAGYNPEEYDGSVGVYVGKSMSSYLYLNVYPHVKKVLAGGNLLAAIGNDKDSMATTISYHMDLKGPSIAIQSSSSTSLVSVCIACQSLLTYQCDMALAGGITAGPPLKGGYIYDVGGIMAKDGHNRSFDKDSTGFVPGNGCGVVVLKRLDDAIKDQDFIWAVIKGYNINNDGYHKISYTAPSSEAQAELIAGTLAMANIHPEQIGYIEAHGTGTKLGDPIEVKGATKAFRYFTNKKNFCAIGSVKSNIGHLDSAAGIAGLIKTVLALHYKEIPPSINFKVPNPEMRIEESPFYVNTGLKTWEEINGRRLAGVTSLGMGGTNAHVILQDANIEYAQSISSDKYLFTLSAKSQDALKNRIRDLGNLLLKADYSLSDVAYTLSTGRKHFQYRTALLVKNREQAIAQLRELAETGQHTFVSTTQRQVAFCFSPFGSLYEKLGEDLYHNTEIFKAHFDNCAEMVKSLSGHDISAVYHQKVSREEWASLIQSPQKAIPFEFSFQYSLAKYLMEIGIKPEVLIGHGLGELVAAAVADVFLLKDMFRFILAGSRYFTEDKDKALMVINTSESEVKKILPVPIHIAAANSPFNTVIYAENAHLKEYTSILENSNIPFQLLKGACSISTSNHDILLTELHSILNSTEIRKPTIPIISMVSGEKIADEAMRADYWARSIIEKIAFADCISSAIKQASYQFLIIGAENILAKFIAHVNQMANSSAVTLSTVREESDMVSDSGFLITTIKNLWLNGVHIDWLQYYKNESRRKVPLPTYAFDKIKYWIPSEFETGSTGEVKPSVKKPIVTQEKVNNRPPLSTEYIQPISNTEIKLCEIWENLLSIHPIGVNDNFFDLDGHSLLATQMISRINEAFNIQLPMEAVFDYQTISEVAKLIDDKKEQNTDTSLDNLLLEISSLSQDEVKNELNKN